MVLEASASDEKLQLRVFHCLGSWMALGVIPQQHLMASKLLSAVFSAMVNNLSSPWRPTDFRSWLGGRKGIWPVKQESCAIANITTLCDFVVQYAISVTIQQ